MKLNYKRTFFIGLAFMVISVFWGFYDQAIAYILKYEFDKGEMIANLIMSIDNVLALFMLPLFGALSDKTNTRLGKRIPYILIGTTLSVIFFLGMGVGISQQNFWMFFVMLFLTLLAMATYRSPAVALMPDLTPRALRSKANAIINIMGGVGSAFAMVAIMFLVKSEKDAEGGTIYNQGQNYWPVIAVIAGFMVVGTLTLFFTIKEKKLSEQLHREGYLTEEDTQDDDTPKGRVGEKLPKPVLKSLILILSSVALWYIAYNGMSTNLSRYCQEIMNKDLSGSSAYSLVTLLVTGVAMAPLAFISVKLGRKKTIIGGVCLMTVAFVCGAFITAKTPEILVYMIFSVIGIGWAAINVNSYPMVVEIATAGDVGKYTGYYYTFSMAAQVITPLLTAALIDKKWLNLGYRALFPYCAVFMVLAFVCMIFVKHGDAPATDTPAQN